MNVRQGVITVILMACCFKLYMHVTERTVLTQLSQHFQVVFLDLHL